MIQPMKDRILVKRIEQQRLIHITDAEKSRKVEILAVGPKVKEVYPGERWILPGIVSNEPDFEFADGSFLIQQNDLGVRIAN